MKRETRSLSRQLVTSPMAIFPLPQTRLTRLTHILNNPLIRQLRLLLQFNPHHLLQSPLM